MKLTQNAERLNYVWIRGWSVMYVCVPLNVNGSRQNSLPLLLLLELISLPPLLVLRVSRFTHYRHVHV